MSDTPAPTGKGLSVFVYVLTCAAIVGIYFYYAKRSDARLQATHDMMVNSVPHAPSVADAFAHPADNGKPPSTVPGVPPRAPEAKAGE